MMADRQTKTISGLDTLIFERNSLAEKEIDPDVVGIVGELIALVDRMVPYEVKMELAEKDALVMMDTREVQTRSSCDDFNMVVPLVEHDMMLEGKTSVPSVQVSSALVLSIKESQVHVQINECDVGLPFQEFKTESNDLHKVEVVAAHVSQELVDQTSQQPDEEMDESTGVEQQYMFNQSWGKVQDDEPGRQVVEDFWQEGIKVLEEVFLLLRERDDEGKTADHLVLDENDRVIESPQPNDFTVQELGVGIMVQPTGQPEDNDEVVERGPENVNKSQQVFQIQNSGIEEMEVSTTAAQPDEKSDTKSQANKDKDIESGENKATEMNNHSLLSKDDRIWNVLPESRLVKESRFEAMEEHQTSSQSDEEPGTAVLRHFENRIEDLVPVVQIIQGLGVETVGVFATRAQPDEGSKTDGQSLPDEDGTVQKSLLSQLVQDLGIKTSDESMFIGQPQRKCGAVSQMPSQDSELEAHMGQEAGVITVEEFCIARKPNEDTITRIETLQNLEFHPSGQKFQECEIGAMELVPTGIESVDEDGSVQVGEKSAKAGQFNDKSKLAGDSLEETMASEESVSADQLVRESENKAVHRSFTGQPHEDTETDRESHDAKETCITGEPHEDLCAAIELSLQNEDSGLQDCGQEIQDCEMETMATAGQPTDKDDNTEEPRVVSLSIQDSGVEAVKEPATVGQLGEKAEVAGRERKETMACESDPAVQPVQESHAAMEESFTGQPDEDPKTASQMKTRKSLQEEHTIQESEPYCNVKTDVYGTALKNSGLNSRECYTGDILQVPAEAKKENNSNKTNNEKLVKTDDNALTDSGTGQRSDDEKIDVIGSQIPGFSRINFYAVQPDELIHSTAKHTSKWTVNFSYYVKEEETPMKDHDEKMYCEDICVDTITTQMITESEISCEKDTQCAPLSKTQSHLNLDGNHEQTAASLSTSQCCENENTITQSEKDFGAPHKHLDSVATDDIDVTKEEAAVEHHCEETSACLKTSDGSEQANASNKSCFTNSSRTDCPDEEMMKCENETFVLMKSSAVTARSGEDIPDAAKCVSFASPLTKLHEYQVLSQDSFASQSTLDISELLNTDQDEECDLNAELQLIFEGKMDRAGSQRADISCQLRREPECSLDEKDSNENISLLNESDVGQQSASSPFPEPEGFTFMHQLPNNPGRVNFSSFYRTLGTRTRNDIFSISDNSMQYVEADEENSLYDCEPSTKEKKMVDQVSLNCDGLLKEPQSSEDLYEDIEHGQDQEECRGSQEVPDELEVLCEPIDTEECEDQAVPSMKNDTEEPSTRCCLNAPSCGFGNFGSGACLWQYPAASTTSDHVIDGSMNELPTIQPLQPCRKPVRIGLSKRQRVAHLHPYLRPKTS